MWCWADSVQWVFRTTAVKFGLKLAISSVKLRGAAVSPHFTLSHCFHIAIRQSIMATLRICCFSFSYLIANSVRLWFIDQTTTRLIKEIIGRSIAMRNNIVAFLVTWFLWEAIILRALFHLFANASLMLFLQKSTVAADEIRYELFFPSSQHYLWICLEPLSVTFPVSS